MYTQNSSYIKSEKKKLQCSKKIKRKKNHLTLRLNICFCVSTVLETQDAQCDPYEIWKN